MSRFTRGGGAGGGGGWRARLAAKKAAEAAGGGGGGAGGGETGMVLRVSRTGFGFVGQSVTARQRYYFHFRDVVGGTNKDSAQLVVGDRVTYDTRMNDDTMEKEAYNVRKVGGGRGTRGVRGMGNAERESAGRSSDGRTATGRRLAHSTTGSTSQRRTVKAAAAPRLQTQKTNDHTDQFGRLRKEEELSGGLLDLVGLDGDDEEDVTIAASCDDYDINPDGGIGFSIDYQRSRGRDVEQKPAAAPNTSSTAEEIETKPGVGVESKAIRPALFSQRGRGRRLADM